MSTPLPPIAAEGPDVASSSDEYAQRFAGPVGEFFLATQTRMVLEHLQSVPNSSVLDVGGGHAQLTPLLAARGYQMTVVGSDSVCRQRLDGLMANNDFRFVTSDLQTLPFDDRQFEVVIAFRMMAHVAAPERFLRELCRVARHSVIVDYPDWHSVNWLTGLMYRWKQAVEGDTRRYRCLYTRDIKEWLAGEGFVIDSRRGQFALPMALHRAVRMASVSRLAESLARALGITNRLGSPVVLAARRKGTV